MAEILLVDVPTCPPKTSAGITITIEFQGQDDFLFEVTVKASD